MGDFVLRKGVKEANLLLFCSHHTKLEALDVIILRKFGKDIYVQSNHVIKCSERLSASFQTAASSQVTPEFPPRSPCLHPCESKMQSEQGEAGGQAAMLLSTQLAYHRGLWCHPCISYGNRSFKDNKTGLPTGIVNTLQHTLVPQSSIGSVEALNLDGAQAGTTVLTHTRTHTQHFGMARKGGQLHRGSQDATSQTSAACCMTRVGTEWELVHCPLFACVCLWLWLNFSGQECFRKELPSRKPLSFLFPSFQSCHATGVITVASVGTGVSHAFF